MWRTAIENHKTLLKSRPDPSYWSDNIIDASSILKEPKDWAIFYSYLTNGPRFFNIQSPVVGPTLGEMETIPSIPPYGLDQTVRVFKNGNIETICVSNVGDDDVEMVDNMDDEKVE